MIMIRSHGRGREKLRWGKWPAGVGHARVGHVADLRLLAWCGRRARARRHGTHHGSATYAWGWVSLEIHGQESRAATDFGAFGGSTEVEDTYRVCFWLETSGDSGRMRLSRHCLGRTKSPPISCRGRGDASRDVGSVDRWG